MSEQIEGLGDSTLRVRVPVPPPLPFSTPSREYYTTLEEYEADHCTVGYQDFVGELRFFELHETNPEKRARLVEWFGSKDCQKARSEIFDGKRRDHSDSRRIGDLWDLCLSASREEADNEALYGQTVGEIKNSRELLGYKVAKAVIEKDVAELVRDLTAAVEQSRNRPRSLDAFIAMGRFISLKERLPTGAPELQSFMADLRLDGKEMTSENLQREVKKLGFHPL